MASRALGLKRLLEGNPIEVREALRRYFVDGRIVVTPVAEGYYVDEGRLLPLVALTDPTLETTKPLFGGPRLENFRSLRGGDSFDVPRGFLDYLRRAGGLRFPEVPPARSAG